MSKRFNQGNHVVVVSGGLPEFHGSAGDVQYVEFDGTTRMYRVRLDSAVVVPLHDGQSMLVKDDLWSGDHLALACPYCDTRVRRVGRAPNGLRPIEGVGAGCEFCNPTPARSVSTGKWRNFTSHERLGKSMSLELSSPAGLPDFAPEPDQMRDEGDSDGNRRPYPWV